MGKVLTLRTWKRSFSVIFCLALCSHIHAATLALDPSVSTGELGCGLSYYLVSNPSGKGTADFALARKYLPESKGTEEEALFSRNCTDSLPHFPRRDIMDFLAQNGIAYPSGGYISAAKDAVLYHFRNIDLSRTDKITDSTLLLLFDIVLRTAEKHDSEENIRNQAIIISGDIDKNAILGKMEMLSLMVDRGIQRTGTVTGLKEEKQAGTITEGMLYSDVSTNPSSGMSSVRTVFYGPVLPDSLRGTSVSLMSAMFWNEFRIAAEIRISTMLKKRGIPYSSIRMRHTGTSESGENEKYSISVGIKDKDTAEVRRVVSRVLEDFRENGLTKNEYLFAKNTASRDLYSRSVAVSRENSDYVRKCFNAFVYGAPVVSGKDEADFFLSSGLADSTGRKLLNEYISLLIPPCSDTGEDSSGMAYGPGFHASDTLLLDSARNKVKLRRTRDSKSTDGKIWEFANGMTVIYKKMPANGTMWYSWVLRDGFSSVQDLAEGEGAFFSDMLFQGSICGMDGQEFRKLLASEGISINAAVDAADMRIYGSAPFNRLTLLLKALAAMAGHYSSDEAAAQYYMECERLRLSTLRGEYRSRLAVIDSIMCPGYRYYRNKSVSGLTDGIPAKAEDFFREQFAKSNDGALVLIGDMDEYDVRKILEQYIGGFQVRKHVLKRPSVMYQPVSGWSTYVTDGRATSIDVVLSTRLTLNSTSHMASQIATMAINDAITKALSGLGMTASVNGTCQMFPHERFTVSISSMPVSLSTLPATVSHGSYFRCLYSIRSAVTKLVENGVDGKMLDVYKNALIDRYASTESDPAVLLRQISDRISKGKNLDSGYKDKISAVTADDVNKMLEALDKGSKVEYIIKKD